MILPSLVKARIRRVTRALARTWGRGLEILHQSRFLMPFSCTSSGLISTKSSGTPTAPFHALEIEFRFLPQIPNSRRHIVDCGLQFFIEHPCHAIDFRILKLSEQARWKVILDDSFLWTVLSNVEPKRSVKSRSNVLLRHLERKERI